MTDVPEDKDTASKSRAATQDDFGIDSQEQRIRVVRQEKSWVTFGKLPNF